MLKEFLTESRPLFELVFSLMDELEQKEAELKDVRRISKRLSDDSNKAIQEIGKLKRENHALQMFIEEHVDEEKKKLIFK